MKVLYISDRQPGGIVNHVKCLTDCLPPDVERYVIGVGGDEPFAGRSGHDWREWFQVRRVIKAFRPDVIHFHTNPLFMELYVKFFFRGRVVSSIHTPSVTAHPEFSRRLVNWAAEPCYWLPVSGANWKRFNACYPKARGEVFFNPVRIDGRMGGEKRWRAAGQDFVVGMVGRNAGQKDWPKFCEVVDEVERAVEKRGGGGARNGEVRFWGVGVSAEEAKPYGAGAKLVEWKGVQGKGREWIGKMDLFVLTSKHEELPTVVLECFMMRTPICGFVPAGGMEDILALSNGALREVFVGERDSAKLSEIVVKLRDDGELRRRVVEDGWQILVSHFDAERNVRGRLMDIYAQTR